LGLTDNEAYRRLAAVRLAREFPALLDPIRTGRVTLTNVLLGLGFPNKDAERALAEMAGPARVGRGLKAPRSTTPTAEKRPAAPRTWLEVAPEHDAAGRQEALAPQLGLVLGKVSAAG